MILHGLSLELTIFHHFPMVFHNLPMVFQCLSYGFPMVFQWFSHASPFTYRRKHRATQVIGEHQVAIADAAQHAAEAADQGLRVHQRREVRRDPKPEEMINKKW